MRFVKQVLMGFLWGVCGWHQSALAQSSDDANRCAEEVVERVGKHFRLKSFSYPREGMSPSEENGGLIVAGVCKPWPADKGRMVAAFAYDGGTDYEKQLYLAVVAVPGGRVMASYKGSITEDSASEVTPYSLRLDTARYNLSKSVRAFALRVDAFRERCGYDGGFNDELSLFVIEGRTLRPVLSQTMSTWQYGPGNRCGGEEVSVSEVNVVISIEPTSSNGFADLRLTERRSDHKKPTSAIVKYDGSHYDLKPWTRAVGARVD